MRRGILLVSCLLLPLCAHAASTNRVLWVQGAVQYLSWKEDADGIGDVEEKGPLVGLVGGVRTPVMTTWQFEGRGQVYAGIVDYEGTVLMPADRVRPYRTDTTYLGMESEALIGRPLARGPLTWTPFAGLGFQAWTRDLDTQDDGDMGDYGYTENWFSYFAAAGLEIRGGPWHGRAALRLPVYNRETVDFSNVGWDDEVELEPGRAPGLAVEAGYTWRQWRFTLAYDQERFDRSGVDSSGFYQPESDRRVLSAQAGLQF